MRAAVTITDLTRMQGDHICVAGYLRNGTCIRPRFQWKPLTESWVWLKNMVVIRPFTEVELELLEHKPESPHSEDWWVNPTYYRLLRILKPDVRLSLLNKIEDPSVESIFGATIHQESGWFLMAGEGTRSLGTVKVAGIQKVGYTCKDGGRWDYRIAFTDGTGTQYRLAVTDLAFRYYLDYARLREGHTAEEAARRLLSTLQSAEVYLRIGLARGWEKYPDRCHLQITGVYSFPDYLGGKCFADFSLSARPRATADIEAPF